MKSTSSDDTGVHRVTNEPELLFEHRLLRRLRVGVGLSPGDLAAQLHCGASQIAAAESGRAIPCGQLRAALEEWMAERLATSAVPSRASTDGRGSAPDAIRQDGAERFVRCAEELDGARAVSRARTMRDTRERALDQAMHLIGRAYVRADDLWFERLSARLEGDRVRADHAGASAALMYRLAANEAKALAEQLAAIASLADDRSRQKAGPTEWTASGAPPGTSLVRHPRPRRRERNASDRSACQHNLP
jgi:hypothetical protein